MNPLDTRHRAAILTETANTAFDVVVIGGGITGAGILREASLRGLKVLLVEAADFASGTSSKSTKLIHGGIRYLQTGHFHVVREAAIERKRVHQLAPHLATPQWLVLPASGALEHAKYRVGVSLYEQLGQVAAADRHYNLRGSELHAFEPLLDTSRFPYATVYREYLTDDARLVMANIRAGVRAGGVALNYLAVTGVLRSAGGVSGVTVTCGLSGESFAVNAATVINAAGPWVEDVCGLAAVSNQKSLVLSKGSHVAIPRARLPVRHPLLLVQEDGRPLFAVPRDDVVYLGTTDSRYDQSDHWPEVTAAEISYLFAPLRRYFGVNLQESDCLGTWAGLRPLISQRGKNTTEISRRDEVWVSEPGFITVAGGKLTGYRKMAEDTVDRTLEVSGLRGRASASDEPLPGGDISGSLGDEVARLRQRSNCSEASIARLVNLYGAEASRVLDLGNAPLLNGSNVLTGEVHWSITQEGVVHLEDFVYRRSRVALYEPAEMQMIDAAATLMGALLSWSEQQRNDEVAAVRARFAADMAPAAQLALTSGSNQLTALSS